MALNNLERYASAVDRAVFFGTLAQHPGAIPLLARLGGASQFLADALRRRPQNLAWLLEGGTMRQWLADALEADLAASLAPFTTRAARMNGLRRFKYRQLLRVACRDLLGDADLTVTTEELSHLADVCLAEAWRVSEAAAREEYGAPLDEGGRETGLCVIAMGKLGGEELNYSSDIDLMFAYGADGETAGGRSGRVANGEFFARVARDLCEFIEAVTDEGYAFRVDLRLRPFGSAGRVALSFAAMEQYYQREGRDWERYAWIKARPVAGDLAAGKRLCDSLRPFVFRRYLDYGTLEAIRGMKTMIAREVERKGMADNIKLGAGGIREIEFIVQTQQLIRAGREPALQERATMGALARLAHAGHLDADAAQRLHDAYVFLRDTEHRLQMIADRRVHALPVDGVDRARVALGMGFADWESFAATLAAHRATVSKLFDTLVAFPEPLPGTPRAAADTLAEDAVRELRRAGYERPEEVDALLRGLRAGPAWRALSAEGRTRLDRLIPLLLAAVAPVPEPSATLARLIRLLETIGRRTAYFSLLIENPMALAQLVKLAAASPWTAEWIGQHPVLLDELLDPRTLYALPTRDALERELRARLEPIAPDDLEAQMNVLREFRNGQMLRVAAADIGPGVAPETVGRQLATLAEVLLAQSLAFAERALVQRHGAPQDANGRTLGFAVIGYGKLGGIELGYASDLDMIFLYEDSAHGQTAGARPIPNELFFARLGQRLIHILTTRSAAGVLYEVDMRLRPSGQSGPLVTSINAYRDYQRANAWTWEHQALVRARAVAGQPQLGGQFEQVRRDVLALARDPERVRTEVRDMRTRMLGARRSGDDFDVKHDRGGIVDIEFMVQYWVLRWAHDHPDLTRHTDNINILETLARIGLIDAAPARLLISAYRRYLSVEHRLKLMERGARAPRIELDGLPEQVARVWGEVMETGVA